MTAKDVNFQIQRDAQKLISLVHGLTISFPSNYRYSLGQEMHRDAFKLFLSIHKMNQSPGITDDFYQIQDLMEVLKLEVALGYDLNIIDPDRNIELIQLIQTIRNQIVWYQNSTINKRNNFQSENRITSAQ
jgi:hypothetical protein